MPAYMPTWSGFGYQSSWSVTFCGGGAAGGRRTAGGRAADEPQDAREQGEHERGKSRVRMVCIPPLA